MRYILRFLKTFFFFILVSFVSLSQIYATEYNKTGVLEYFCKDLNSSFKRPPINIKFSGKSFYGEVKFFSKKRNKYFIQSFSGSVQFNGKYQIFSNIYNLDRKKLTKPGFIKFDKSGRQNPEVVLYLKMGVKSKMGKRNCVLKLIKVNTSLRKDRIKAAEKKLKENNEKRIAKENAKRKREEEENKKKYAERLASAEKKLEEKQKKKIAEEKELKKKEAAEKARKKKLAEQKRKRKIEQDKIAQKIRVYKRKALNFYKDIEEFVKSGGNIDLVKLSDFFDIKPNPTKNWNSSDLKTYENLRQYMDSVSEFVTFEKQRIGERLKKSFALKDQSIDQLKKNLDDLKGLMRKMFGSNDMPKIKKMIKDIEASLANFNQLKANKLITQTSNYISSKLDKHKVVEKNKQTKIVKKASLDQNWSDYRSKMSIQQGQFCQLIDSFFDDLKNARKSKNEIKVNIVHKERQGDLDALIPGGKISNWIFKVVKIDQVEDGSAAVVLSLQCKSYVGSGQIHTKSTWRKKNNKEWRATIPYNDRRFRELAKLDSGEFVVGSGIMLEIGAYKPGQKETFYASQQIGEHPLTKDLNLEGELFIADLSYIAALK